MTEQQNRPRNSAKAEAKQITPEERIQQDRGLVWQFLGDNENLRMLRATLLDQKIETLKAWNTDAEKLQGEISRAYAWHNARGMDNDAENQGR